MNRFSRSFWTFLFAENLYDFGIYIFVLLYNLYLLDLGYREDFLGWVTTALTAGSIVGSLPSAAVARMLGLKRMLIFGSAGMALLCAVRALPLGGPGLLAAAFVSAGLLGLGRVPGAGGGRADHPKKIARWASASGPAGASGWGCSAAR